MKEPVKRESIPREPVALEPEPVVNVDVPHLNDDWIHIQAAAKKRPLPPIDEGGWRTCAREDCGQGFAPEPKSRAFCSDECAQINFYREHGMLDKAAALVATEKRDDDGNIVRNERTSTSPENEAKKDARYGPLREIDRVLSESKGRKRVVFKGCAHEATVKADVKRSRCRKCRNAASKPEGDATKRPTREPVKREPVAMMTPEEFVKRGQAAQNAVNKAIKEEAKKLVPVTEKAFKKAHDAVKMAHENPTVTKARRQAHKKVTRKPVAKKPVRKNPIKPKRRKK